MGRYERAGDGNERGEGREDFEFSDEEPVIGPPELTPADHQEALEHFVGLHTLAQDVVDAVPPDRRRPVVENERLTGVQVDSVSQVEGYETLPVWSVRYGALGGNGKFVADFQFNEVDTRRPDRIKETTVGLSFEGDGTVTYHVTKYDASYFNATGEKGYRGSTSGGIVKHPERLARIAENIAERLEVE